MARFKKNDPYTFDTLAYAKRLKAAGFSTTQAEVQAEVFFQFVREQLVTQRDLKSLEHIVQVEIDSVRRTLTEIREENKLRYLKLRDVDLNRLHTEMQQVRVDLQAELEKLRTELFSALEKFKLEFRVTIGQLENKVDAVDTKLENKIDALDVKLENKIDALDVKLNKKIDAVDTKLENKIDALDAKLENKIDLTWQLLHKEMEIMRRDLKLWLGGFAAVTISTLSCVFGFIAHFLMH